MQMLMRSSHKYLPLLRDAQLNLNRNRKYGAGLTRSVLIIGGAQTNKLRRQYGKKIEAGAEGHLLAVQMHSTRALHFMNLRRV